MEGVQEADPGGSSISTLDVQSNIPVVLIAQFKIILCIISQACLSSWSKLYKGMLEHDSEKKMLQNLK